MTFKQIYNSVIDNEIFSRYYNLYKKKVMYLATVTNFGGEGHTLINKCTISIYEWIN